MDLAFFSRHKHVWLFLAGFAAPFMLGLFMGQRPPELDKVWEGISGAFAQGVLLGVAVVFPVLVAYGFRERNIVHAGMIFSLCAGVLVSGPPTSLLSGYPLMWSVLCPVIALVFLSLVYRMLYRFHFRKRVTA